MKRLVFASFLVILLIISLSIGAERNIGAKAQTGTIPTEGLMAWWKLNEGSGTAVVDSSGNGKGGTINGGTWSTTAGISSLSFDGKSSYVSLPTLDLNNLNSVTVVSWIYCDLTKSGFVLYNGNLGEIELGNGDLSQEAQGLNLNSTQANFNVKLTDSNWCRIYSSSPMQPNAWHQIAGVWVRGSYLKVYVDGTLAGENNNVSNLALFDPGTSFPASLGVYSQDFWGQTDLFKGQISNVMVYDRSLDSDEIQALYNHLGQALPKTALTLSCVSSTAQQTFNVFNISGCLTSDGAAVSDAPVYVSYSVTGGRTWEDLTLIDTDSNGFYSALWLPTVTGNYQLKTIYNGDEHFLGASKTISFAIEPTADRNVFSISSNSTVTALSFNSASNELSFNVTGAAGTSGYTYVFIPSSLLNDTNALTVQLDGVPTNYTVNSQNDGWLLYFEYHHSSHSVSISLGLPAGIMSINSTNLGPLANYVLLAIAAIAVLAVVVLFMVFRPNKNKSITLAQES